MLPVPENDSEGVLHLHVLAADGAFLPDGRFVALPQVPGKSSCRGFSARRARFSGEE